MNNNFQKLKSLSIEEKIGQLMFVGIMSDELDPVSEKLLEVIKPAGVCLFTRNIKNARKTRNLLDQITDKLPFQPFLSLDQEGGLVDRLRRIVEPMPSIADIYRSGNVSFIKKHAELTAQIIGILGFNMNFAPVADVADKDRIDFVMNNQLRIYGISQKEVYEFTKKYISQLQKFGIIGCLKHFPGIGAVQFDPHEELPFVNIKEDELYETDLFPFIENFKNKNIYAVMSGHIAFPELDLQEYDSNGKLLPASLSSNFLTGLLREKLNYDELILTDDLEMGAIVSNYGIGQAATMAFQAGSDFLLICSKAESVYEAFESMKKAVQDGEITEDRIDESLKRIGRVRNLLQKPLEFNQHRLDELSLEIREFKDSL